MSDFLFRDEQAEADAALGAAVRDWLDSYRITAKRMRNWLDDPLHVERLTEQCTEALYKCLATVLEAEEEVDNE
jgi:hypothetical protein